MEQLLRDLIAGQKEQTELLRQHLTRIKFSLRALLLLMTGLAIGMWFIAYEYRPSPIRAMTTVYTPFPQIAAPYAPSVSPNAQSSPPPVAPVPMPL